MRRNSVFGILIAGFAGMMLYASCRSETELNYIRYYTAGKTLYEANCQNCHGNDGAGLAMLYPPLTDTLFLKNNKSRLACIIKYGLKGKIAVAGKEFEGEMPAHGQLSNIEIAEIITYVTNSFGNKQGLHNAETVAKEVAACK